MFKALSGLVADFKGFTSRLVYGVDDLPPYIDIVKRGPKFGLDHVYLDEKEVTGQALKSERERLLVSDQEWKRSCELFVMWLVESYNSGEFFDYDGRDYLVALDQQKENKLTSYDASVLVKHRAEPRGDPLNPRLIDDQTRKVGDIIHKKEEIKRRIKCLQYFYSILELLEKSGVISLEADGSVLTVNNTPYRLEFPPVTLPVARPVYRRYDVFPRFNRLLLVEVFLSDANYLSRIAAERNRMSDARRLLRRKQLLDGTLFSLDRIFFLQYYADLENKAKCDVRKLERIRRIMTPPEGDVSEVQFLLSVSILAKKKYADLPVNLDARYHFSQMIDQEILRMGYIITESGITDIKPEERKAWTERCVADIVKGVNLVTNLPAPSAPPVAPSIDFSKPIKVKHTKYNGTLRVYYFKSEEYPDIQFIVRESGISYKIGKEETSMKPGEDWNFIVDGNLIRRKEYPLERFKSAEGVDSVTNLLNEDPSAAGVDVVTDLLNEALEGPPEEVTSTDKEKAEAILSKRQKMDPVDLSGHLTDVVDESEDDACQVCRQKANPDTNEHMVCRCINCLRSFHWSCFPDTYQGERLTPDFMYDMVKKKWIGTERNVWRCFSCKQLLGGDTIEAKEMHLKQVRSEIASNTAFLRAVIGVTDQFVALDRELEDAMNPTIRRMADKRIHGPQVVKVCDKIRYLRGEELKILNDLVRTPTDRYQQNARLYQTHLALIEKYKKELHQLNNYYANMSTL